MNSYKLNSHQSTTSLVPESPLQGNSSCKTNPDIPQPLIHPIPSSDTVDLKVQVIEFRTSVNYTGALSILALPFIMLFNTLSTLVNFRAIRSMEAHTDLAVDAYDRFERSNSHQALEEAVAHFREVLVHCPSSYPDQWRYQSNLANAVTSRFEQMGRTEDLEEAIGLYRNILLRCSGLNEERSTILCHLAGALQHRVERSSTSHDLEEAISLSEEALALCPAHNPSRSLALERLAATLFERFKQSNDRSDLHRAIIYNREALLLRPAPHPHRSASLMNLASTLHAQFLQSGDRNDVDESILLSRQCLDLAPSPSPGRFIPLNHLANNLLERFTISGVQKDLDEAIIFGQEAITLVLPSHPHRVESLTNFSNALRARFEALGRYADLEDATAYLREVLSLIPGPTHRLYAITLHNLANALTRRFQHSNNIEDLEEAIYLRREALTCSPVSHADRPDTLSHLAHILHIRFQRLGDRHNLDEAILLHKETLSLSSSQHPHHFVFMNLLSATLLSRAERFGKLLVEEEAFHNMDEIITLLREATAICPYSKQLVPLRSNLANALILKFQDYSGDLDDWEEGFHILKQLTDDAMLKTHPSLSILSENLGNALLQRRKNYQSIANLVVGVKNVAKKYQIDVELTEKLSRLRLGLAEIASQYPSISSIVENIGTNAMVRRPDHEFEQLDDAMVAFEVAASSNSSSIISRFRAAVAWSQHAAASNHKSALDAYRAAINFVPMLASLGHDLLKRQEVLTQTGYNELVRDAAICAIRAGKYDTAIELLEAGRAVIWMQMLQLRTPMDDLCTISPTLVNRLAEISAELERGSHRATDQNVHGNQEKMVSEKEASYFLRLNKQWVEMIADVRQLDGFEDFLAPRKLSTLQAAASKGPVILLIAGTSESDALIMTSNSVLHLKLPNIDIHKARKMTLALRADVQQGVRSNASPTPEREISTNRYGHKFGHRNEESPIGNILKVLWETVVEPIVQKLYLTKSECPITIRWCPTGIFSFLPFHAAGVYRSDMSSVDSISEYAVSSYTPTIAALLRVPRTAPSHAFKMLVAIESNSLPYTVHELNKIEMRVASECLVKLGVSGSPASIKTVLAHLSSVSIAHFACHAQQDSANPLDSALILEQEDLKISQIMQQPMPNASLAFLCACETAMGDENLPDENLHLGATLLYSGFSAVIATMWAINDEDGPTVSDNFYAELFQHDSACPDMTQTARAIHVATAKLRSQSVSFNRWVPFIHIGD